MSGRDYRDEVIEALALSEAMLQERVDALAERAVLAETERDAFRLVAVQGIHYIHDLQADLVDLRERYHRALDDARGLRVRMLQADENRAAA